MAVAPSGEVVGLSSKSAMPDPVVRALAHWRFKKGGFELPVKVFARYKLDANVERAQSPRWYGTGPIYKAIKSAANLDAEKAKQLSANLPQGEEPDHPRGTLLAYYAGKGSVDVDAARKTRRDLISWLIQTYPQDAILGSSYAVINAAGEPLADPDGAALVKKAWLDALKPYPTDNSVLQGAANFLRIADPVAAAQAIGSRRDWNERTNWLGSVYASAGLGVNALTPETGAAAAVSSPKLTDDGLAASFRKALLESTDLKTVLSGMATTTNIARDLTARNSLPDGYGEYCEALLKHTRDLYPQTSFNCDTAPLPKKPAIGPQRIGGNVMQANLMKKVQPRYPQEAKDKRMQGTVEFIARISPDGHVQNLQLVRGPLLLYEAAYDAVIQWEYRPVLLNGTPVTVITDIIVNFTLSQ